METSAELADVSRLGCALAIARGDSSAALARVDALREAHVPLDRLITVRDPVWKAAAGAQADRRRGIKGGLQGRTLLDVAVEAGELAVSRALLAAGASVALPGWDGRCAFERALDRYGQIGGARGTSARGGGAEVADDLRVITDMAREDPAGVLASGQVRRLAREATLVVALEAVVESLTRGACAGPGAARFAREMIAEAITVQCDPALECLLERVPVSWLRGKQRFATVAVGIAAREHNLTALERLLKRDALPPRGQARQFVLGLAFRRVLERLSQEPQAAQARGALEAVLRQGFDLSAPMEPGHAGTLPLEFAHTQLSGRPWGAEDLLVHLQERARAQERARTLARREHTAPGRPTSTSDEPEPQL